VSDKALAALRETGVVVIRNVIPKDDTERLLDDVRGYFGRHPMNGFPAQGEKKVVYESYWSPSQVKARSHPNMLATQRWMNQRYIADADQRSESQNPHKLQ
jgi:hypothetical protein